MSNEKTLNGEWRILKFSECIQQLNTGLNPRKNFSLGNGKIKYITAKNLTKSGTIDFSKCDYINEEAKRIINRRSDIKVGDILFSSRAPIGHCHLIKEEPDFFDIGESIFSIRVKQEIVLPEYLCLYLTSEHFIKIASKNTTGSIISEIRVSDLMDISVIVPPKQVQKNIANCINTIDNKLGNNNAINAELESMARTIYDYWFLQFEFPNEEGKPYKSSGGKMVWNEELKREIPEGWKVGKIGDICSFENGDRGENYPNSSEFVASGIPFLSGSCIENNSITFSEVRYITCEKSATLRSGKARKNDILFTLRGTLGKCVFSPFEHAVINAALVIMRNVEGTSRQYLYSTVISDYYQKIFLNNNNGSIQANLSVEIISDCKCIIPPSIVQDKYDACLSAIRDRISKVYEENQELASLRDFLLPLLMNGQVGFKDKDGEE